WEFISVSPPSSARRSLSQFSRDSPPAAAVSLELSSGCVCWVSTSGAGCAVSCAKAPALRARAENTERAVKGSFFIAFLLEWNVSLRHRYIRHADEKKGRNASMKEV